MAFEEKKLVYLLEHRIDYRSLYALNFLIYTGAEIKTFDSPIQLIEELKEVAPDVMIVNSSVFPPSLDYGEKLHAVLKPLKEKPQVLYLGESKASKLDYFTAAPFDYNLKKIVRFIARALGVTAKSMAEEELPEYFPVPMKYVLPGWYLTQKVYREDHGNYIQLLDEGEIFEDSVLASLEIEGAESVFVKSDHRVRFVESFTTGMVERLNDDSLSIDEKHEDHDKVFKMVKQQISKVGITEGAIELADAAMKSMVDTCDTVPELDALLQSLKSDVYSLRYRHSMITAYIAIALLKKMPWSNREQIDKMSFVAFFHDISLDEDMYIMFKSDEEVDKSDLSWEEKMKIKNHAKESAKLVAQIKRAPFGVDTIIKQHHGNKKGDSLSNVSMSVSPMAIVFLLAEEWAHLVLDKEDHGKKFDKKTVIEELNKKYRLQTFKKVIPYLNDLEI